jgi:hypothetical protein
MIEPGEAVGAVGAQSLSEPGKEMRCRLEDEVVVAVVAGAVAVAVAVTAAVAAAVAVAVTAAVAVAV